MAEDLDETNATDWHFRGIDLTWLQCLVLVATYFLSLYAICAGWI